MLRKLRPRLSFANVTSLLALFVALGGTGAVALSGSNTVFSDDIANDNFNSPTEGQGGLVASGLRAGSVGSSEVANGSLKAEDYGIGSVSGARIQDNNVTTLDLADNAIFGNPDIANNSVTGDDVNEASLSQVPSAANGARRIVYNDPPSADIRPLLTIGEMTISADCVGGGGSASLSLFVDTTVAAGVDLGFVTRTDDLGAATPQALGDGITPTQAFGRALAIAGDGHFQRAEGQFIYSNANRIISVAFHGVANGVTDDCVLYGTAVPAPG